MAVLDNIVELNGVEITTKEKLKILGRYPKEAEEYEEEEDDDYYKHKNYEKEQIEFSKYEYDVFFLKKVRLKLRYAR